MLPGHSTLHIDHDRWSHPGGRRLTTGNTHRSTTRNARFVRLSLVVLALASVVIVPAGCGGENTEAALSPSAEAGRLTAQRLGCPACHGLEGQGLEGLGPAWQGLLESDVTLSDGTRVRADREYLRRSILDPDAHRVKGFTLPMPPYRPTDEELAALLDYLQEVR